MLRQLRRKLRQICLRIFGRIGAFGYFGSTGQSGIAEREAEQGALVGVREIAPKVVERKELVAKRAGERASVEPGNGTDKSNSNGDNRQKQ